MKRTHWLVLSSALTLTTGLAFANVTKDATWLYDQIVSTVGVRTAVFLTTDLGLDKQHQMENAISHALSWTSDQDLMRNTDGITAGKEAPDVEKQDNDTFKLSSKLRAHEPKVDEPHEIFMRWLAGYDLRLAETVKTQFEQQLKDGYPSYLGFVNTPVNGEQSGLIDATDTLGTFGKLAEHTNTSLDSIIGQMGAYFTNKMVQGHHDLRCDATFNENLRDGIAEQIKGTYPNKRGLLPDENNPLDRLRYISRSYLPLANDGHLYTVPKNVPNAGHSTGRMRLVLPAPAMLMTKNADGSNAPFTSWKMSSISQQANPPIQTSAATFTKIDLMARRPRTTGSSYFPVVEIQFDKDYDNINKDTGKLDLNGLDVTARFGELDLDAPILSKGQLPYQDCNMADVFPVNFTNPEAAIVVRGKVDVKNLFPDSLNKQIDGKFNNAVKTATADVDKLTHYFHDAKFNNWLKTKIPAELAAKEAKLRVKDETSIEELLNGTELALVIHQLKLRLNRKAHPLPLTKAGDIDFTAAKLQDATFDDIQVQKDGMEASVVVFFPQSAPIYWAFKDLAKDAVRNALWCGKLSGVDGMDGQERCALRFDTGNSFSGDHLSKVRGLIDQKVMQQVVQQLQNTIQANAATGLTQVDAAVKGAELAMRKTFLSERKELGTKVTTTLQAMDASGGSKNASDSDVTSQIQKLLSTAQSAFGQK